jgi:hypothetical protein
MRSGNTALDRVHQAGSLLGPDHVFERGNGNIDAVRLTTTTERARST